MSHRKPWLRLWEVMLAACVLALATQRVWAQGFVVEPQKVVLRGNFERVQLLVRQSPDGKQLLPDSQDLTHQCSYQVADPRVATVSPTGLVLAQGNGSTTITVSYEGHQVQVPVEVSQVSDPPRVGYRHLVAPIFNKAGCTIGACHAAQYGKGGFKLSVFGSEVYADHRAVVRDRRQRRVNFLEPEKSLLLLKPTTEVAHGGGKRLDRHSVEYEALRAWIASGAPGPEPKYPRLVGIRVWPNHRICRLGEQQQLRVEVQYEDGTWRDVTPLARFDSMDEMMLEVTPGGLVRVKGKGQGPIMVRFEGQAAVALFVVPYAQGVKLAGWKDHNFVDRLAAKKFRELGIEPSPLCDDATFLRRAFLDAIGSLPTVEETRAFLADKDPRKREKLVDRLLGLTGDPNLDIYNDRYAAYWTIKWSDLLRVNSKQIGEQAMWAIHNWLRESFRTNKPFDQMVRELITAKGSVFSNGPANYYRIFNNAPALTEATAQLFLGVRLECAKCHHHPFEKYSLDDYYGFAAFFARVGTKTSQEFGLFSRESIVVVRLGGEVRHPKTGRVMKPTPLEGTPVDHPLDRRIALAQWLTSPENAFFARSIVNRYVSYLLGRGLVEPVDDMRSTNPATNPELLDALAEHFVKSGFDIKQVMRVIMTSRLYQLDWRPNEQNAKDFRFYSHYYVKRLAAEPLLDAVDQATGTRTKFPKLPLGTRAIELPDAEYPNYFLNTFGKPRRATVCECERSKEENLAQALHLLNGDILARKISDPNGRVAQLIKRKVKPEQAIEELYLATLCRYPRPEELKAALQLVQEAPSLKEGYEDLLWALINSKEFLFNH